MQITTINLKCTQCESCRRSFLMFTRQTPLVLAHVATHQKDPAKFPQNFRTTTTVPLFFLSPLCLMLHVHNCFSLFHTMFIFEHTSRMKIEPYGRVFTQGHPQKPIKTQPNDQITSRMASWVCTTSTHTNIHYKNKAKAQSSSISLCNTLETIELIHFSAPRLFLSFSLSRRSTAVQIIFMSVVLL